MHHSRLELQAPSFWVLRHLQLAAGDIILPDAIPGTCFMFMGWCERPRPHTAMQAMSCVRKAWPVAAAHSHRSSQGLSHGASLRENRTCGKSLVASGNSVVPGTFQATVLFAASKLTGATEGKNSPTVTLVVNVDLLVSANARHQGSWQEGEGGAEHS